MSDMFCSYINYDRRTRAGTPAGHGTGGRPLPPPVADGGQRRTGAARCLRYRPGYPV